MDFTIRETREGDFTNILSLMQASEISTAYLTQERFNRMLAKNRGFSYVAEAGGKIVGSIFGEHDGGFTGSIRRLAVAEQYRRQSIGSALVRRVVKEFEKADIPWKYCHVEESNDASIELFRSLGFQLRKTHYLMDKGPAK